MQSSVVGGTGSEAEVWGEDHNGNLGTIYIQQAIAAPAPMEGIDNIGEIALGGNFSAILLNNGTVDTTGANGRGQLGDEELEGLDSWEVGRTHVQVRAASETEKEKQGSKPLSEVKAVAATGRTGFVLMDNGTVASWGNNEYGELGVGTDGFESDDRTKSAVPHEVEKAGYEKGVSGGQLTGVAALYGTVALMKDGTLMAWGRETGGRKGVFVSEGEAEKCGHTELARKEEPCSTRARPVLLSAGKPLTGVKGVASGNESSYALVPSPHLTEKGFRVLSWGAQRFGQLGIGNSSKLAWQRPREVLMVTPHGTAPLTEVKAIAANFNDVIVLRENGELYGWGDNAEGQLGAAGAESCGRTPCNTIAKPIAGLEGIRVVQIAAGLSVNFVRSEEGKVYGFGRNNFGQLLTTKCENEGGRQGQKPECYFRRPQLLSALGTVRSIAASATHMAALLAGGTKALASPVELTPGKLSLKVKWTADDLSRILYRVYEKPAAEVCEEAEGEECGGGEAGGNAGLENIVPPRIKHVEFATNGQGEQEQELTQLGGEVFVGDVLAATTGEWSGSPTAFEVQWEREENGEWKPIGQKQRYESAEPSTYEHEVEAADVGHVLRVTITVGGEGQQSAASEHSAATPMVKNGKRERTFLDIRPATAAELETAEKELQYIITEACLGGRKEICGGRGHPEEHELSPTKWYEVIVEMKAEKHGRAGEDADRRMVAKPEA